MSEDRERLKEQIRAMPLGRLMRIRLDPLIRTAVGSDTPLLTMAVTHVERALIEAALERTGGHMGATAELLGIHRNTLRQKIRSYGLRGTRRRGTRL
jgi:DNA-binding NtrC family response regulator